jgi:hypothetical protein
MLFNILADATEDNAKLGAQAIDVAHRTHNKFLDAIGVNSILPSPIKDLADKVYNTNQRLVLNAGHESAEFMRKIE